jgi:hypothetical protein
MNTIVLAVFIFTESKRFPRASINREEIPLDPTLIVVVQLASAHCSIFDCAHFGHKAPNPKLH